MVEVAPLLQTLVVEIIPLSEVEVLSPAPLLEGLLAPFPAALKSDALLFYFIVLIVVVIVFVVYLFLLLLLPVVVLTFSEKNSTVNPLIIWSKWVCITTAGLGFFPKTLPSLYW